VPACRHPARGHGRAKIEAGIARQRRTCPGPSAKPDEPQGLNSVFNTDTVTPAIITPANEKPAAFQAQRMEFVFAFAALLAA